jgi:hypothetical protein
MNTIERTKQAGEWVILAQDAYQYKDIYYTWEKHGPRCLPVLRHLLYMGETPTHILWLDWAKEKKWRRYMESRSQRRKIRDLM